MDVVLFTDPSTVMLEHIAHFPEIAIFAQCDENPLDIPNNMYTCTNVRQCPQICTGIIVIKNDPDLYSLFLYTDSDVQRLQGDQELFLEKANEHKVAFFNN